MKERIRRGPLLMVVAAFFFSAMIAAVKLARRDLSALEVIAWRGAIALPLAYVAAGRGGLRLDNRRVFLVRVCLGFTAMICFYTAAKGLSVADLSLIAKLQPVVVGILAPLLLGRRERVGWLIWVAMAGGVVGSAVLIGPDLLVGSWYGLYAAVAALLSAGAHVSIRLLGRTERSTAVVFWFQAALIMLAVVATLVVDGRLPRVPAGDLWIPVLATGVFATLGQLAMTKAYQLDQATLVAGASYSGPLWAVLIDVLILDDLPTVTTVAGGALIILSGLAFLRRG